MSASTTSFSSPAPFAGPDSPPPATSTAPSSPPAEASTLDDDEPEATTAGGKPTLDSVDDEERYSRLQYMLDKSSIYAGLLKKRMDEARVNMQRQAKPAAPTPPTAKGKARATRGKGRKSAVADSDDEPATDAPAAKRAKAEADAAAGEETLPPIEQPRLVTGTKLKDYQLEGLAWMASLYENGISGILADEMGLGKTLQTIAFNAHFRERSNKPFLVVCPLSVLHNWGTEFAKFAPEIPTCTYHGTPAERAELRRTAMQPAADIAADIWAGRAPSASTPKPKGRPSKKARKSAAAAPAAASTSKAKAKAKPRRGKAADDVDEEEEEEEERGAARGMPENTFPVVLTTYEMVIKDRAFLGAYSWGYIVVDEGHRLKNFDSRLMREIKQYESAGRMVLTGTPLQNNLAELWSLLNFILPDIFQDLSLFQEWFNLPTMQTSISSDRSSRIVHSLHAILKPFLLRRMKVDVETGLPPKKEYVLYAPLTERQRQVYDAVLGGGLRSFLIAGKAATEDAAAATRAGPQLTAAELAAPRKMRSQPGKGGKGKKRKRYDVDGDDDEYFERLENGEELEAAENEGVVEAGTKEEGHSVGRDWMYKSSVKQVNNMKLQNTVMQLRKVCSHPFLFDWPLDPVTHQPVVDSELVDASGKMMVLERLLDELFKRGHKVLLFSQFTTMLDIVEDWAAEFKGWDLCRIDGSTPPAGRREQMERFQTGGDAPDAPRLFLLSTRAGGLGINLTAADTVIFYDQDWNPQMDAQAQDRAHRIGQTKPVLIFRLVSKHTIETKIMQRATEKRQLEALVIAKGKFKMPTAAAARGKPETMAEMAASLLRLEGEQIEVVPGTAAGRASVLDDADLNMLLDRSPAVFEERGRGWTSEAAKGAAKGEKEAKGGEAFAVFEAPVDQGNEALANMLGEEAVV